MMWNDAVVPFARDKDGPCFAAGVKTNLQFWGTIILVASVTAAIAVKWIF